MSLYKGLSFPLGNTLQDFVEDKGDYAMLKTSIMNILFTIQGERVMRPRFGSGLPLKLFEPLDEILEGELERMIKDDIRRSDPRIDIVSVVFDNSETDNKNLKITVGFRDKNTNTEDVQYMDMSFDSSGNPI